MAISPPDHSSAPAAGSVSELRRAPLREIRDFREAVAKQLANFSFGCRGIVQIARGPIQPWGFGPVSPVVLVLAFVKRSLILMVALPYMAIVTVIGIVFHFVLFLLSFLSAVLEAIGTFPPFSFLSGWPRRIAVIIALVELGELVRALLPNLLHAVLS